MHMLEIIMNSIAAGATLIQITVNDSLLRNVIEMIVTDNGKGMSEEFVKTVMDPFTTSRTTRKVGMGVAFMKGLTEQCGGTFDVKSKLGVGTTLTATVQKDHIDTPAMGNLGEMMMYCIQSNADIDYEFTYRTDAGEYKCNTVEIKETLDGVSILEPEILLWVKDYINGGIQELKEEAE